MFSRPCFIYQNFNFHTPESFISWKINVFHTRKIQCSHTGEFHFLTKSMFTHQFFSEKSMFSTPGKFNVHTLGCFFFLKKQCFHTRKIKCSHTRESFDFLKNSMFTHQKSLIYWFWVNFHEFFSGISASNARRKNNVAIGVFQRKSKFNSRGVIGSPANSMNTENSVSGNRNPLSASMSYDFFHIHTALLIPLAHHILILTCPLLWTKNHVFSSIRDEKLISNPHC